MVVQLAYGDVTSVVAYTWGCNGCGQQFETDLYRRRTCDTCRKGVHPGRTARRQHHNVSFVGVDGESVNRPDGSHEYVMLSVGDHTLFEGGRRLGFSEIMGFLWKAHLAAPEAVMVGFFLGYDFTQWQRLLPEHIARSLITAAGIEARKSNNPKNPYPDCVVYEGWEFDVLANRRWKLRPHHHVPSKFGASCRNRTCSYVFDAVPDDVGPLRMGETDWEPPTVPGSYGDKDVTWRTFKDVLVAKDCRPQDYMYVCDTGSFWQTSFLNVINPASWSEPVCTEAEYALVRQGKSVRDVVVPVGDVSYSEDMAAYNRLENDILARVTTRLNRGFVSGDIKIKLGKDEWYGPGRAAQKWMNMLSERVSVRAKDIFEVMPEWAVEACRASYYGGWFEIPMHGHVGTVYEYDINSAYPHVISSLPCLLHGSWTRGDSVPPEGRYVLVHADVHGSDAFLGAMPHRDRSGRISRPHRVKGWYWVDELEASKAAGLVDSYTVDGWVAFNPGCNHNPFDPEDIGITRMYETRLQVGKDTPQGKGLKLVYNSAYGKTAQSIGYPRFANPFYASRITAGTRCTILRAIASHPVGSASVAMVATDGVYFTSVHGGLPEGSSLGTWESKTKHGMTLHMPGVYWDDKARQAVATGTPVPVRSRGVSGKDIARVLERLDMCWTRVLNRLIRELKFEGWPSVDIPVGFSVTSAQLALHRGAWATAGCVCACRCTVHPEAGCTSGKRLSGDPSSKRNPFPYLDRGGPSDVLRTAVIDVQTPYESVPYDKSFGWEQHVLDGLVDCVPDDFGEWEDFFANGMVP